MLKRTDLTQEAKRARHLSEQDPGKAAADSYDIADVNKLTCVQSPAAQNGLSWPTCTASVNSSGGLKSVGPAREGAALDGEGAGELLLGVHRRRKPSTTTTSTVHVLLQVLQVLKKNLEGSNKKEIRGEIFI